MDNRDIIRRKFYLILIVVTTLAIVCVLIYASNHKRNEESHLARTYENGSSKEKLFENAEKKEEVVTINTEIIEDGLKEMGTLITEEYYFTQVEEYTSTTKAWVFFDSTAKFTYSYDGTVSAGIDCNKISVDKDDEQKIIKISVPKAEIINVFIDHNSFKIYEEKNGLWNKIDMEKYNDSIIEFEEAARTKAQEKGIIDKADEGARKMIESFVRSIADTDEYTIELTTG
ncbi:MAG: DUF4230 domain-containing protein [Lachnospiraceae bacterium]|nr:DUF4230 domain-containing protein [Lachnospiraceae bacterium]